MKDSEVLSDSAVFKIQPYASVAEEMICQIIFLCLVFSVTLSVWIYLLKWCHKKLCGIIHHVNRKNSYDSVLIQLTDAGGSQQLVGTPDTGSGNYTEAPRDDCK